MLDEIIITMKEKATEAMKNAYQPYSHFSVGAAILADDGKIYVGCNVENVIFIATHAEGAAIASMISHGAKRIKKMVIVADSDRIIVPCGMCRQHIAEFAHEDLEIYNFNRKGDYKLHTLKEFLPFAFSPEYLEEK